MTGKGVAPIEELIATIRGHRVILAADLARIYGVQTRVLNQAVKRNREKFPADFMYQITRDEAQKIQRLRSQIVILKPGQHLKPSPYPFTEHGGIMAANVLDSSRAVQMIVLRPRCFGSLVISSRSVLAAAAGSGWTARSSANLQWRPASRVSPCCRAF